MSMKSGSGQKFHRVARIPKSWHSSRSIFSPIPLFPFTMLYAGNTSAIACLEGFAFHGAPQAHIWMYPLDFDPVSSFNRLHHSPYFIIGFLVQYKPSPDYVPISHICISKHGGRQRNPRRSKSSFPFTCVLNFQREHRVHRRVQANNQTLSSLWRACRPHTHGRIRWDFDIGGLAHHCSQASWLGYRSFLGRNFLSSDEHGLPAILRKLFSHLREEANCTCLHCFLSGWHPARRRGP